MVDRGAKIFITKCAQCHNISEVQFGIYADLQTLFIGGNVCIREVAVGKVPIFMMLLEERRAHTLDISTHPACGIRVYFIHEQHSEMI